MKKKNKFKVELLLDKLLAVPYVQEHFFVKIKMLKGGDVCGVSDRQQVLNHEVVWNQTMHFEAKLYTDVSGTLIPCFVQASIKQETNGGKSSAKLGVVIFDLAPFAKGGMMTKRYLLQAGNGAEVKENSVLKIGVKMTQISGDPVFRTDPLDATTTQQQQKSDRDSLVTEAVPGTFIELSELNKTIVQMQDIANLSSEGMALAPSEFQEWKKTRVAADDVIEGLFTCFPPRLNIGPSITATNDDEQGLTDLFLSQTASPTVPNVP
eukprot:m.104586 g.104586  ORF g.104586 m.104586 type:complete len:265 (-) comp27576_c0_seq4:58-852(-)